MGGEDVLGLKLVVTADAMRAYPMSRAAEGDGEAEEWRHPSPFPAPTDG